MCVYSCLSYNVKTSTWSVIILYVTLRIEDIFRVSLWREIERKRTCFARRWKKKKFGDVLAEKKVTLSWLMHSNMVKPEKIDHLHIVYHFTVPLKQTKLNNWFLQYSNSIHSIHNFKQFKVLPCFDHKCLLKNCRICDFSWSCALQKHAVSCEIHNYNLAASW